MKIIADNKIPYLKGVLEPLANIEYYPGKEINAAKLKNADALIIRTRTKCDKTLLSGSSVKYIATATIGFDHIDTAYCDANNIQWTNAPGCNSGSVMQYMASALIRIAFKHNFSLSDKTIGIVGVGHVGSKVAKLATALGIKVLLNDPPRERIEGSKEFVSLEEIQKNADIISFHVPLNLGGPDKTYRLFNKDFLNGIKNEAVIINTSRGEVVSEKILKEGLKNKRISAAVLDVWENEPEIDEGLLTLVDIATPHIAGYSADGKANGTVMSIHALSRQYNLKLDTWYPADIKQVHKPDFNIDCHNLSIQEVINKAILSTYDVLQDDKLLRRSPREFEELRENYPLRREFHAYSPHLLNDTENISLVLNALGFCIPSDNYQI